MGSLFMLLGFVALAIPIAVVFLLVRVGSLRDQLATMSKRVSLLEDTMVTPYTKPSLSMAPQVSAVAPQDEPIPEFDLDLDDAVISALEAKSDSHPQVSSERGSDHNQKMSSTKESPFVSQSGSNDKPQSDIAPAANTDQPIDILIAMVKRYFTEGNLIVRVGVLVLFVGVAFLLKYASDNSKLSIEVRVIGVALSGIGMLTLGWVLRRKREDYALVLQGAGVGILYLTAFASLKLYQLLPPTFVFGCLVLMVAFTVALAVLQNARSLAILAISGGFLAPVLVSTGGGSHIALFTYYLILNLGILAVAWFKSWRLLNVIGFVFTFVISGAWGVKSYQSEFLISVDGFLIAFFLFYLIISLLFARKQPPELKGYVDGTLVFGLPIVAFSLHAALVQHIPYALAMSSLVMGFVYAGLARFYWLRGGESLRLLSESFLVLGIVFLSLTIPFALDGQWIATAWALEGAALIWISVRQSRQLGVAFGLILQLVAGFGFLDLAPVSAATFAFINSTFMAAVFIAAAAIFSSYYLRRHSTSLPNWVGSFTLPCLMWGLLWWACGGLREIIVHIPASYHVVSLLLFTGVSALVALFLEYRLAWRELSFSGVAVAAAMVVMLLISVEQQVHFFGSMAWLGWIVALGSYYLFLYVHDKGIIAEHDIYQRCSSGLHIAGVWLIAILAMTESIWFANQILGLSFAWLDLAYILPCLVLVYLITTYRRWPIHAVTKDYVAISALPLILLSIVWFVFGNISSTAVAAPLPYLPLLNPLDIAMAAVLVMLVVWWKQAAIFYAGKVEPTTVPIAAAGLAFFWLNAMLLRSLHHWSAMPYTPEAIHQSELAQSCLTVFWTVIGLSVMMISARKSWRKLWLASAALLGMTLVKLFFLDLADRDGLITIFTFIIVGLLLLVVGYFSPLPPKKELIAKNRDSFYV